MHSGGFSFINSTAGAMGSSSLLYPVAQSSLAMQQAPRFVNRLREYPLDLRYRPVLTPPSTPSPPRKRKNLLNLDLRTFESDESEVKIGKSFSAMNQFSSTISIDDKKYFQNSMDHAFPSTSKAQSDVRVWEPSEDFIDITSSDNEMESAQADQVKIADVEFRRSESILTDDNSNNSDDSDEIVDIESNEDSVVFSELMNRSTNDVENTAILENGKSIFDDPSLHSKALEGFAKLFDSSMYNITDIPMREIKKSSTNAGPIRSKNERKRVKSRKQMVDEETTSPVSGTIIRKLHDGEELVVRKGDIDPVRTT